MAKTASSMVELGTSAPHFCLTNVFDGKLVSLDDHKPYKATVIMFICNHCPYVKHTNSGMIALAKDYASKSIRFIAINSNDVTQYPDDSPEQMKKTAEELAYPFPYLYDETQEVAKAYSAACTPDFYVYNDELALVYRGQLDDSRPGNNIPVTGASIRAALDSLLKNEPITVEQKPSLGCNIKWKQN